LLTYGLFFNKKVTLLLEHLRWTYIPIRHLKL